MSDNAGTASSVLCKMLIRRNDFCYCSSSSHSRTRLSCHHRCIIMPNWYWQRPCFFNPPQLFHLLLPFVNELEIGYEMVAHVSLAWFTWWLVLLKNGRFVQDGKLIMTSIYVTLKLIIKHLDTLQCKMHSLTVGLRIWSLVSYFHVSNKYCVSYHLFFVNRYCICNRPPDWDYGFLLGHR